MKNPSVVKFCNWEAEELRVLESLSVVPHFSSVVASLSLKWEKSGSCLKEGRLLCKSICICISVQGTQELVICIGVITCQLL